MAWDKKGGKDDDELGIVRTDSIVNNHPGFC